MTDLLPVAPESLPAEVDPTEYMLTVLNRAKEWLTEARSIEDVRDAKAIAVGYEAVIREKELAFDAQLAATEIVRRCERRIGELVREGQERGDIYRQGQGGGGDHQPGVRGSAPRDHDAARGQEDDRRTVADAFGVQRHSSRAVHETYAMADAPDDTFEDAIAEAREEGNLSRANVVRKVRGEKAPENGRSEWHRGRHHIDPNRIVRELDMALIAATAGLDLVDSSALDREACGAHFASIRNSLRTVSRQLGRWLA